MVTFVYIGIYIYNTGGRIAANQNHITINASIYRAFQKTPIRDYNVGIVSVFIDTYNVSKFGFDS